MILPIISSISRELFLGVPPELKEGALGLGATRWEMVRGVILPYTRSGVAAAMILGLGRALGEAIAVAQVIGGFDNAVSWNLFTTGDTLGGQDRGPVPERGLEHRELVALLPRADPARLLAHRELCSRRRSSAVRATAQGHAT